MRNAQKTPLAISLQNAAQKKVQDAIALLGKALPAQIVSIDGTGTIATVNFLVQTSLFTLPNVQCAVATSQFARAPLGAGVKGVVWSMDTYIGNVTGLGGGNADLSLPGNLSALIFIPVGNTGFGSTDDARAYVLYGPDGCILRTVDKASVLTVSAAGAVIKVPLGKSVQITTLPVSAAGLPPGSLWNNGNVVNVV